MKEVRNENVRDLVVFICKFQLGCHFFEILLLLLKPSSQQIGSQAKTGTEDFANLLQLQLVIENCLPLMQTGESVDLLLVFASDLCASVA